MFFKVLSVNTDVPTVLKVKYTDGVYTDIVLFKSTVNGVTCTNNNCSLVPIDAMPPEFYDMYKVAIHMVE